MTKEKKIQNIINILNVNSFPRDFNNQWVEDELLYSNTEGDLDEIGVNIYYGATKLVLDPIEENFVIKIPFNTRVGWDNLDNEDITYKLHNALDYETGEHTWDYCRSEESLYNTAKKFNLATFFAKTTFYNIIDALNLEVRFYLQEKCIIQDHKSNSIEQSKIKRLEELENSTHYYDFPFDLATALLRDYPAMKVAQLMRFLNKKDIRDLHFGNWGVGSNGKTMLIDYSDYRE